jgi:hypothetical protein
MSGAVPPLPQYAFMAWCSVKAQEQLYLSPLSSQITDFIQHYEIIWNSDIQRNPHHCSAKFKYQPPHVELVMDEEILTYVSLRMVWFSSVDHFSDYGLDYRDSTPVRGRDLLLAITPLSLSLQSGG